MPFDVWRFGCVSSTLAPVEPAAPTSVLSLSAEEQKTNQLRAEGIAEIRAKADAAPHNAQAPAYGVPRQGETSLLTPAEIRAKTSQMRVTPLKLIQQFQMLKFWPLSAN